MRIISLRKTLRSLFLSGPPTGGDGGSFRSSLDNLNERHKDYKVFLDGISVCEVENPSLSQSHIIAPIFRARKWSAMESGW